ncbi:hypothetical protein GGS26DRAFT_572110 [Hypomontagnella submonticulosa]|nr:hypothetical protein GGS26DRAFT_572110 [Hypomontagnella submonticulosa]
MYAQAVQRLGTYLPSMTILQILLASMVALGTLSHNLVKERSVLPRSLCTIASMIGFLASSHLCDSDIEIIPRGSRLITQRKPQYHSEG